MFVNAFSIVFSRYSVLLLYDVCLCSHGATAIFSDSVVDVVCDSDSDVLAMVVAELSVDGVVVAVVLVLPVPPEVDVLEVLDEEEEVCC